MAQINAVDHHPAILRIDQAQRQTRDGGLARAGWSHKRRGRARRRREADARQAHRPRRVPEADILEHQGRPLPRRRRQRHGVWGVGYVRRHGPKLQHLLHVDERLPDFPVVHAQDIQRAIDLLQDQDAGGHAADGHGARMTLAVQVVQARQDGDQRQPQAHHHRLDGVQQLQGGVRLHRRVGVAQHGRLVLAHHSILGAEGLQGLEVHQPVHRQARRLAVGFVQQPAMLDAPVGDAEGEGDVDDDGGDRHGGQPPAEMRGQHIGRHQQLEHRGPEVEDHAAQQEVRRARAPVDDPRQAAGLLALVEVQRQRQGVGEGLGRRSGKGRLRHRREDGIAHIRRRIGDEPQQHPAQGETGKAGEDRFDAAASMVQVIDGALDQQRRRHPRPLAQQDQRQGQAQPCLQTPGPGPQHQTHQVGH